MEIRTNYNPNEWAVPFHTSPIKHICLVGGLGGGKTRAAIEELKALALENPGFTYLIARKTMPSLRDTTMKTFFSCMEDGLIKKHDKTNSVVTLVNNSEFIFRGLDDLEKFKSLEIGGKFVDEANEITRPMYDTLKSRVRQQVNGKPPTMYRTIIALNPGEESEWIPQLFLHERPPNHQMFTSTTLDNLKNLPEGYIEELKSTYTKDMQQRMIYGLFGRVHKGQPVYPQFQRGDYIRSIDYDPLSPLVRGWDFGFNHPVCVWAQMKGTQLRVLGECLGNQIYLDDFIKKEVIPYQNQLFPQPKTKAIDFCDPRGSDESDKGKTSVQICNEHGFWPIYRRTWIEEGIKIVKNFMDTLEKGSGDFNFLIHPRCKNLIEGLRGGYSRINGEETPNKDNIFDNSQDAMRYLAVHCAQRAKINLLMREQAKTQVYVNRFTGRRVES